MAAPELLLSVPLADDGPRSVYCVPGQLCEELRNCSRRQAESNQAWKRRQVYCSQCTQREDTQLGVLPPGIQQQTPQELMLLNLLSDFRYHARIAAVARLYEINHMLGSVSAGAGGHGIVRQRRDADGVRLQRQLRWLM